MKLLKSKTVLSALAFIAVGVVRFLVPDNPGVERICEGLLILFGGTGAIALRAGVEKVKNAK